MPRPLSASLLLLTACSPITEPHPAPHPATPPAEITFTGLADGDTLTVRQYTRSCFYAQSLELRFIGTSEGIVVAGVAIVWRGEVWAGTEGIQVQKRSREVGMRVLSAAALNGLDRLLDLYQRENASPTCVSSDADSTSLSLSGSSVSEVYRTFGCARFDFVVQADSSIEIRRKPGILSLSDVAAVSYQDADEQVNKGAR